MTYDDLNDAEKTYALSLARSMATLDFPGMQAASDAATAAGLTEDQKLQAAYIVQYQDTPAIGEAAQQAQSQILGTQVARRPGPMTTSTTTRRPTPALRPAAWRPLDFPGMQAASDAATAAGLSDSQKAQVAYIVQYQDTPAIGEAVNQVRAGSASPEEARRTRPGQGIPRPQSSRAAYALSLARPWQDRRRRRHATAGDAATVRSKRRSKGPSGLHRPDPIDSGHQCRLRERWVVEWCSGQQRRRCPHVPRRASQGEESQAMLELRKAALAPHSSTCMSGAMWELRAAAPASLSPKGQQGAELARARHQWMPIPTPNPL